MTRYTDTPRYAELCVTSNFTFLTGASHPEEYMLKAQILGLAAVAITDVNSLAGVVRAWSTRKSLQAQHPDASLPQLIVGSRLILQDCAVQWVALPTNKSAWQQLSRLISLGKRRSEKGQCTLYLDDLVQAARGMILIAIPPHHGWPHDLEPAFGPISDMQRRFPGFVYTGAAPRYDGTDQPWFQACADLALRTSAPMVAIGDVMMHSAARRPLADILTCIRKGVSIDHIGTRALPNSERRLKGADDMARLFRHHPAAIRRSLDIANRCAFDLGELRYQYPSENSDGETAQQRLERLTQMGLGQRCAADIPPRYQNLLDKELSVIGELGYAPYFLTVHDIVQEAKSRGILCQGRGSAANSIICWALGITDVSPDMIGMVFERFISRHRGEPPDIDVDFEHERREEIFQWIYERYGRDRAGLCATVIHFRSRAAIAEVGKAMGLPREVTSGLSSAIWGQSDDGVRADALTAMGLNPNDRRLRQMIHLVQEIIGFPRHLSQHVGGFVITQDHLDALCPIGNAAMEDRTFIEWDKDDIDALKILKIDILSLGMLTCIRKSLDLLKYHEGIDHKLSTIPQEDHATYDMLQVADAIGVFQVESRAQMNFLPRMKPATFYDLVIEVAIVRPGPIQGGMVKPYIRRRQGLDAPEPFGPALAAITAKTLGVPLFQEQAMQIAQVGAGYSAEEADHLRRSLASFRRMGTIGAHKERFIKGMLSNGYDASIAEACFAQIEGFADYGFPESHAAAFAMLTYISSWLKCHHPAIFTCALLNSQPMGFYAPAQLIRDARDHGVEVRPICVNASQWDNHLERRGDGRLALRLGMRQIKSFSQMDAETIVNQRRNGYFDPESLWLRTGVSPAILSRLAEADAFASMGLTRRDALWAVKAIRTSKPLPLFSNPLDGESVREPIITLPPMHLGEEVVDDYVTTRMTLRAHPMELLRHQLTQSPLGQKHPITAHDQLLHVTEGEYSVCGLVITRQRPGTASGVVFLTLEDETGVANIVVWPDLLEANRAAVMGGRLLRVTGELQKEGIVTHIIAQKIEDLSSALSWLGHPMDEVIGQTIPQADEAPRPRKISARHPREQAKHLFPSRDFH
ncbi:error-prone DNA polymerase [Sphingopyxis yananensis]|uniref:error-prone DNA polymerase n=1 Tax=Sphingopyxis yananensis TaxID=2886687 RepID=UPI001D10E4CB|nr:error-prone DNA polymerase [Sphingopyxis yananensis]MCC2601031.1 error-prone DNA polymerase [Sphingopyxis yananensis]